MICDPLDFIRPLQGTAPSKRGSRREVSCGQTEVIVDSRNGCQQGEVIAITLGLETDHPVSADEGPRPGFTMPRLRAIVRWGSGGVDNPEALVDFLSGTAFSVAGENVQVSIEYGVWRRPWIKECDPCCLPVFTATATLAYGPRGPAQLTELAQIKDPGKSVLVPVPQYAVSFTVLPAGESLVSATLLPCSEGYGVKDVIVAPLSNLAQSNRIDQIPLFNGARHVRVTNLQEEWPAFAFVVFRVQL